MPLPPSLTYHRFVIGMTGDKMSSSKPETTIFMDDSIDQMTKKVKHAISGANRQLKNTEDLGALYQRTSLSNIFNSFSKEMTQP